MVVKKKVEKNEEPESSSSSYDDDSSDETEGSEPLYNTNYNKAMKATKVTKNGPCLAKKSSSRQWTKGYSHFGSFALFVVNFLMFLSSILTRQAIYLSENVFSIGPALLKPALVTSECANEDCLRKKKKVKGMRANIVW